ncbi:MAG: HNH endonuclease, partial [Candidatus Limnocylindrales bacterium]
AGKEPDRGDGQPLPQGAVLRHACGNLRCVRPDHMTLVTGRPGERSSPA